ncbi:MAG: hypothetical protein IKX66_05460, partial [Clostridia bacterium]|nr:hypothetical protein [Clostridia bacterium]
MNEMRFVFFLSRSDISIFARLRGKHIETDASGGYIELRGLTLPRNISNAGGAMDLRRAGRDPIYLATLDSRY